MDPEADLDREFLTVDGTGGRFHRRLYWSSTIALKPLGGHGQGASAIALDASGDGGLNFDRPALRIAEPPRQASGIGNGDVLSDGTFVVLYNLTEPRLRAGAVMAAGPNARLGIGRSTDGGRTFERDMPEIGWSACVTRSHRPHQRIVVCPKRAAGHDLRADRGRPVVEASWHTAPRLLRPRPGVA